MSALTPVVPASIASTLMGREGSRRDVPRCASGPSRPRVVRRDDSRGEGKQSMRIGVLTGGGDCPGLNAVIRAVVRKGVQVYGHEFVGFRDGWRGPLEGETVPLGIAAVRGILPRGGTI